MHKLFANLILVLACASPAIAQAQSHWLEVKTDHFTIYSDGSDRQTRHTAGQLERMHAVFARLLPGATDDPGSSIVVLALRDRKSFATVEPAAYLAKNALDLAGLFLQGEDRSYILLRLDTSGDHPYETVYHEYTHYMTRHARYLPVWLNEGLAQFYQNTDILNGEVRLGEPNGNELQYLRQQRLIPLETLFRVDHNSPFYHEQDKGSVFYGESWALTHFLFMQDFSRDEVRLKNYARFVMQGENSLAAAQHAFGDLRLLQSQLETYISRGDYRELKMAFQTAVDEKAMDVHPVPSFEADAVRADVLVRDSRKEEAELLARQVLAEAPQSAEAQECMGWIKLREGDTEAARGYFREAVARHSTSFLAFYYAGALGISPAQNPDKDSAESLRKALELNPRFAPAMVALSQLDAAHHENLDEALRWGLHAVEVDPGNIDYRLAVSEVRVQRKELPQAITGLQTALKLAQSAEDRNRVQARLDQLETYAGQLSRHNTLLAESAAQASAPLNASASTSITTSTAAEARSPQPSSPQPFSPGRVTDRMGNLPRPITPKEPAHPLPEGLPSGPRLTVSGTIRNVGCFYPKGMTLSLEGGAALTLYTNDIYAVAYTSGNGTPDHDLDPCRDFEGLKARITYAKVKDATVAGQIVSMELSQ